MSQRSPQRRASTPPRRGRSPSRTPSRQLDVEVKPAVSAGGLVHYSRYIVPICAALACLVVATLLLRSYVLLFAAKSMPPLVPVFLELGANPRAQDSYGGSPLHAMCASGTPSEHTYRLLLEYGSDLSDTDFFALQPVHYCSVSSPALALQMLRDGARPSPGSSSLIHPLLEAMLAKYQPFSNEVLDYLKVALSLSRPDAANLPLGSGLSPLAAAFLLRAHAASPEVAAHALDFAALLLAKGADSGALHPEGAPLLHYTLQFCSGLANDDAYDDAEARRDFLDVLLDAPALNVSQRDVDQRTALFFACNSSLVTLLVERGADPNAVSLLGETPLEYRLRLLHDSNAPALEAGVIGALHRNGAHLGNTSRLLTALVLDDSALKTPLADHLAQLVAFATQELRLPFLRLLDVGERDTELCLTERDVLFYTKHQVPPIKSVLNGHLEITAIRGEFLVSESGVPIAGSAPTTSLRIALRELERVYLRPARKGECITVRASLRSPA